MTKNKGFTLIEILISVVILSTVFLAFLSLFGNSVLMMQMGRVLTNETFSHQENIERQIIDIKEGFIADPTDKDYTISIFSGAYRSDVDVKKIEEHIKSGRYYKLLVSNVKLVDLPIPKITNFNVVTNPTTVFPWIDNISSISASYTTNANPKIFNTRSRWYKSSEIPENEKLFLNKIAFPGGFEVIKETSIDEPMAGGYNDSITKSSGVLEGNRFYYFEVRAFTMAGKLAYAMNENRVPIFNRAGTTQWQTLIENIYFDNGAIVKKPDIFSEVLQNPNHPTLNLGSNTLLDDPQGPMIISQIPTSTSRIEVRFQVDPSTLMLNPEKNGLGVFLGSDIDSGIMTTLDVKENKLTIKEIVGGVYANNSIDEVYLTASDIPELVDFIDGGKFKWQQDYSISIIRKIEIIIFILRLV